MKGRRIAAPPFLFFLPGFLLSSPRSVYTEIWIDRYGTMKLYGIPMKLCRVHKGGVMDFYSADLSTELPLPFAETGVAAGFPSPADDFMELSLDLNKSLVQHPAATFYARVKGTSMTDAGIEDGDILVIDKSLDPKDGDIAVCFLDGEFTVKRIACREEALFLVPANDEFRPIRITEENDFLVWGVVTYIIHKAR
jgi:DNA polymerase V